MMLYLFDGAPKQVLTNPAEFEPMEVSLWLHAADEGDGKQATEMNRWDIVAKLSGYMRAAQEKINDKQRSMLSFLEKSEESSGVIGKVDLGLVPDWGLQGKPETTVAEMPGSKPWLVMQRRHAWRFGKTGLPLPGVACIITALTDDLHIQVYDLTRLLSHGIAISDLQGFLETPSGGTYFSSDCRVMRIPKGAVLFVPFAWVAVAVAVRIEDKLGEIFDPASMMTAPLWVSAWAARLKGPVWAGISAFNPSIFEQASGQRVWKERGDAFQAFADVVPKVST